MAIDLLKAQMVCELLLSQQDGCESLRKCCERIGVPASTFLDWCEANKALGEQYARANSIATDIQFEQLHDLNEERPPTVKGFTDAGWVAWQRMRLDNKKWALSKRRPSKYGDKQLHANQNGDGPVEFVVRSILEKE